MPSLSDFEQIIQQTASGYCFNYHDDVASVKASILDLYSLYKSNSLHVESKSVQQYHRKALTQDLVKLL